MFTLGLAGRGHGYQRGLDWGNSSNTLKYMHTIKKYNMHDTYDQALHCYIFYSLLVFCRKRHVITL